MNRTRLALALLAVLGIGLCLVFLNRQRHRALDPDNQATRMSSTELTSTEAPGRKQTDETGRRNGKSIQVPPRDTSASDLVQEICGPQAGQRLQELTERSSISRPECEILYGFLRQKTCDEKLQRVASIKNVVMNILAQQKQNLPAPWDEMLTMIYEAEDQHWVIRDYALQHLFEFCEEQGR